MHRLPVAGSLRPAPEGLVCGRCACETEPTQLQLPKQVAQLQSFSPGMTVFPVTIGLKTVWTGLTPVTCSSYCLVPLFQDSVDQGFSCVWVSYTLFGLVHNSNSGLIIVLLPQVRYAQMSKALLA